MKKFKLILLSLIFQQSIINLNNINASENPEITINKKEKENFENIQYIYSFIFQIKDKIESLKKEFDIFQNEIESILKNEKDKNKLISILYNNIPRFINIINKDLKLEIGKNNLSNIPDFESNESKEFLLNIINDINNLINENKDSSNSNENNLIIDSNIELKAEDLLKSSEVMIEVIQILNSLNQKIMSGLTSGKYKEDSILNNIKYKVNNNLKSKNDKDFSKLMFDIISNLQENNSMFQQLMLDLSSININNIKESFYILNKSLIISIYNTTLLKILIENRFSKMPSKNEILKKINNLFGSNLFEKLKNNDLNIEISSTGNIIKKIALSIAEEEQGFKIPTIKKTYRSIFMPINSFFSYDQTGKAIYNVLEYPKVFGSLALGYFMCKEDSKTRRLIFDIVDYFKGGKENFDINKDAKNFVKLRELKYLKDYDSSKYKKEIDIYFKDEDLNKIDNSLNNYKTNHLKCEINDKDIIKNDIENYNKLVENITNNYLENLQKLKDTYGKDYSKDDKYYNELEKLNKKKDNSLNFNLLEEYKKHNNLEKSGSELALKNFKEKYAFGSAVEYISSIAIASSLMYFPSKIESETGFLTATKNLILKFHNYMMDIEDNKMEVINIDDAYCPYTIDSEVFENLEKRGDLDWFYRVIAKIKNPFANMEVDFPRVILIEGPSGSGKTLLSNAFAQTIQNIKKNNGKNDSVRFLTVEPKNFYQSDKAKEGDIFEAITSHIINNKLSADVFILYFDEFHLFFTDSAGNLDHSKLANFLKFFSDLKQKQKYTPGGMFIIASTNKPECVPHEMFDNPDRIAKVIRIDYPKYEERIKLMNNFVKKLGVPSENIDFGYISSLLEGLNMSQGNIIEIIKVAISKSQIQHKTLNTEILYDSVNTVARRIHKDMNGLYDKTSKSVSNYYSAIALTSISHSNNIKNLDTITIYPIKPLINPKDVKKIYERPENIPLEYGKAFYSQKGHSIELFSLDLLINDCLNLLSGKVYCEINNIPLIRQSVKDSNEAYKKAYNFFALKKLNITRSFENNENYNNKFSYNDPEINKIALNFLNICSEQLKGFLTNEEVSKSIKSIENELSENKILNYNQINSIESVKNNINNYKKLIKNIYNKIIEISKTI